MVELNLQLALFFMRAVFLRNLSLPINLYPLLFFLINSYFHHSQTINLMSFMHNHSYSWFLSQRLPHYVSFKLLDGTANVVTCNSFHIPIFLVMNLSRKYCLNVSESIHIVLVEEALIFEVRYFWCLF